MAKPRLTTRCPADAYTAADERIVEFSFPEAADGTGTLPGGLIRLQYRDGKPPLVLLYRVEGCEVVVADEDRKGHRPARKDH